MASGETGEKRNGENRLKTGLAAGGNFNRAPGAEKGKNETPRRRTFGWQFYNSFHRFDILRLLKKLLLELV
jgi:hypothetical protein